MSKYYFITTWKIEAPLQNVWDVIYDEVEYPKWWKGVVAVKQIEEGDELGIGAKRVFTWTGVFPYHLTFNVEFVENQPLKKMVGRAYGELEGEGTWVFNYENGITEVICYWDVHPNKAWMQWLEFILKPAFKYNHAVVMDWGAKALAKKLNAKLIGSTTTST